MKFSLVCHGNIARSQVLHHYLNKYALAAGLELEVFSCGTAPEEAYPNAAELLEQVQNELQKRGIEGKVQRTVLDAVARAELKSSDIILVADKTIKEDVEKIIGEYLEPQKIVLFYEYIGAGKKDFVDTYDAETKAQDVARFAHCFAALECIAEQVVQTIKKSI